MVGSALQAEIHAQPSFLISFVKIPDKEFVCVFMFMSRHAYAAMAHVKFKYILFLFFHLYGFWELN